MYEEAVSTNLRSAVDALRATDLRSLSEGALNAGFDELQSAFEALEAERLRWLAEVDRRRTFARGGHLSTQSWLMDRHRVSGSSASSDVRTARSLREMPATAQALASGEVTPGAARVLAQA